MSMGSSTPNPQGGVTMERTFLDPAITQQVQDQFKGSLGGAANTVNSLPGQMQYAGTYEPGNLNLQKNLGLQTNLGLQNRVNLSEVNPFSYSKNLDPLVQSQLSAAQQETAQALGAQKANIAESLRRAPGNNQAMIAALQDDATREASLQSNPYRLNALTAQRAMDAEKYGLNLQGTNLNNQSRLSEGNFYNQSKLNQGQFYNQAQLAQGQFGNQAKLSENDAMARNAQINAGIMAQNNQARLSAVNPQLQYMGMLGQGLMQTTPRVQGSFTMDDLEKLRKNPEMLQSAWDSGIIDPQTLANAMPGYNVSMGTAVTKPMLSNRDMYGALNPNNYPGYNYGYGGMM